MSDETKRDDGGPAFPLSAGTGDSRDGVYCQNGMSLRDWFAGMAMQGIFASDSASNFTSQDVAKRSYDAADIMLTERSKSQ